jgi:hypothetical protein
VAEVLAVNALLAVLVVLKGLLVAEVVAVVRATVEVFVGKALGLETFVSEALAADGFGAEVKGLAAAEVEAVTGVRRDPETRLTKGREGFEVSLAFGAEVEVVFAVGRLGPLFAVIGVVLGRTPTKGCFVATFSGDNGLILVFARVLFAVVVVLLDFDNKVEVLFNVFEGTALEVFKGADEFADDLSLGFDSIFIDFIESFCLESNFLVDFSEDFDSMFFDLSDSLGVCC